MFSLLSWYCTVFYEEMGSGANEVKHHVSQRSMDYFDPAAWVWGLLSGSQSIDALLLIRVMYLTTAFLVLLVSALPSLRSRFFDYGPRASSTLSLDQTKKEHIRRRISGPVSNALDAIARIRVPHSWFASFYAISVFLSLLWAPEILIKGPLFRSVVQLLPQQEQYMTARQVGVTWAMMLVQGSRRLYECLTLTRPSRSEMWAGHWLLGVLFYVGMSVAVWVEGVPSLLTYQFSVQDMAITAPDLRTFVAALLFILASGFQHDCHAYLASLKMRKTTDQTRRTASNYTLPEHPAFNLCITPHYFAECLIYLSLTIMAAPQGVWINGTIACALVFVVINLGITANGTRNWYKDTFGVTTVEGRARMIPFIF